MKNFLIIAATARFLNMMFVFTRSVFSVSKSFQAVSKKIPIDFTPVSDAVIDSLTAQSPRTRYRVGLDSKLFSAIALLPTTLEDLLAKRLRVAPIPKSKNSGPDFVR